MLLPSISIVTPSLNQGRFLERCIRSVLDQEYSGVDHIVIDGGSEDSTAETLKCYPHLRWVSEPDRGQSHALNKGFAMARGDLVMELDSDDELTPGALIAVGRAAMESGGEKVIAGAVELLQEGRRLRIMENRPRSFFRYLNPWIPFSGFSQPGIFIPRAVLASIGRVNEDLTYTMDYDLFCRILKHGVAFHRVDRILARYHLHPDCKTGQGWQVMYPELDGVVLGHARALEGLQRAMFRLSFAVLRPVLRNVSRVVFQRVY